MLENWPQIPENLMKKDADAEINWVIKAITGIRSVRSEMNVPAGAKIPLIVSGSNELTQQRIVRHNDVLKRLARLDTITVQNDFPEGSIQSIVEEAVFAIHLNEVIDVTAETDRLKKEITKVEKEISKISGKLNNQGFLEKAPDAVIQENKSRLQDEQSKLEKLETALDRLS